jgi:hypothetical protein
VWIEKRQFISGDGKGCIRKHGLNGAYLGERRLVEDGVQASVNDLAEVDAHHILALVNKGANYTLMLIRISDNDIAIEWQVEGPGSFSRLSALFNHEYVLIGSAGSVNCLIDEREGVDACGIEGIVHGNVRAKIRTAG